MLYEDPPLGPRDVRLQSVMSGISHGTEMNLYRGTSPFANKRFDGDRRLFLPEHRPETGPKGLGYELVSRVVEVGDQVTELSLGDLVHTATAHRPTTIVDLDRMQSGQIPLQRLPPDLAPEEAIFLALVGVALIGIHDAQIKVGDHVAVFGMGTIGLIVTQLARLSGAIKVVAIDPIAKRREMAARLGADMVIDPNEKDPSQLLKLPDSAIMGADVVIEASGHYGALQAALRSAHMAGRVVTLGYYQGGATPLLLGEEWHHNRLTLVSSMGVWGCPSRYAPMWDRPRITRTSLDLLASDQVQVAKLVTQRFPYDQAPLAYRFIDEHPEETIKVALEYA
jgi:2-desacetyl-2-hydroxyethyl bacteriochlorophyllide A dehydrogenase